MNTYNFLLIFGYFNIILCQFVFYVQSMSWLMVFFRSYIEILFFDCKLTSSFAHFYFNKSSDTHIALRAFIFWGITQAWDIKLACNYTAMQSKNTEFAIKNFIFLITIKYIKTNFWLTTIIQITFSKYLN